LIEKCWHPDPAARPAFDQIIESLEGPACVRLLQTPILFEDDHDALSTQFAIAGAHLPEDIESEAGTVWVSNPVQMLPEV
jgi:hypothetical protein